MNSSLVQISKVLDKKLMFTFRMMMILTSLMMEHGLVLNIINVNQTEGCLYYCQVSNLVQGTRQEVCMYVLMEPEVTVRCWALGQSSGFTTFEV